MLVSAFSPKADIAKVGISTPDEEIVDDEETPSEGGDQ